MIIGGDREDQIERTGLRGPGCRQPVGSLLERCAQLSGRGLDDDLRARQRFIGLEAVEINDQLAFLQQGHELERTGDSLQSRRGAGQSLGLGLVPVVMPLMRGRTARHEHHGDESRPQDRKKSHGKALGR